jgi:hypothetical protein
MSAVATNGNAASVPAMKVLAIFCLEVFNEIRLEVKAWRRCGAKY